VHADLTYSRRLSYISFVLRVGPYLSGQLLLYEVKYCSASNTAQKVRDLLESQILLVMVALVSR
jgi:hypothetical protein